MQAQPTYPHDMRPVFGEAVVEAVDLPREIELLCVALMKKLGLVFGAIDLRQKAGSGECCFLEVNPAGSWSFIEGRALQPISQAVVDEPTRLDRPPRPSGARKTPSHDSVKARP